MAEPLQLYYPIKPFFVGQEWGENKACSNPDRSGVVSQLPDGTCPVGKVKLYPLLGLGGHPGIDLRAGFKQRISNVIKGFVLYRMTNPREGIGVDVISDQPYLLEPQESANMPGGEFYVKVRDYHMISLEVQDNEPVEIGENLGGADNTGLSAGDHDHFELVPMLKKGDKFVEAISNKFRNSIDPDLYWNGKYAEDFLPKPKFIWNQDLEIGMKWLPDIAYLQRALIHQGLFPEEIGATAIFGNITREAVMRFQLRYGIKPVGRVGPITRAKLNELYEA